MPYLLSPIIKPYSPGMWSEGVSFSSVPIYSIAEDKLPPVNYSEYTFKPHSLPHAESLLHIEQNGADIASYFNDLSFFYGYCVLVVLEGDNYRSVNGSNGIYHWEVSLDELKESLSKVLKGKKFPGKILLTTRNYKTTIEGFHDPNYVLTLSQDADNFLCTLEGFNLYGTSWKSSDFNPNSSERPIHKTLFKKAIILELLKLDNIPEGIYFFAGAPIPIFGASESLISPLLFRQNEILLQY